MSESDHVDCPQGRRTKRRRRTHTKWWTDPEWIAFRDAHARVPGAVCHYCGYHHGEQRRDRNGQPRFYVKGAWKGRPMIVSLTINHEDRDAYRSKEEYLKWGTGTKVSCQSCNRNWEKGMIICPVCKVNYMHWASSKCRECRDEENPIEAKERKDRWERQQEINKKDRSLRAKKARAKANPFPCRFKLLTGICSKSSAKSQCTYSRVKCLRNAKDGGCPISKPRVKTEVKKS